MGQTAASRNGTGTSGKQASALPVEISGPKSGHAVNGHEVAAAPTISGERQKRVREAVERFEKPLVKYVLHLTGDLELGRDVVQEAFLRLCNQPEQKVGSYVAEWLYTVCRHLAIDLKRRETRMRLLTDSEADRYIADDETPGDPVEQAESLSNVLRAMNDLPPNQQECIRLKFQHGLSYKQISQITSLSVTNVGFLIHTGLKTLRMRLAESDRHLSAGESRHE